MVNSSFGNQQKAPNSLLLRAAWAPGNSAHAIVKASAFVTYSENITSLQIRRITDAIRELARNGGLVKEDPITTVLFQVAPGAPPKASSEEQAGVTFQDVRGNQVVQTLSITNEGFRFETSAYTRWIAFSKQVESYLAVVLPLVEHSSAVKNVGVEYVDLFYALNAGPADVSLVIDRKSDAIANDAFKKLEAFHCHAGWFEGAGEHSKRLVNVDVNVADSNGPPGVRRTVTIRTHEAEHVNDPSGMRALDLVRVENVIASLDDLHVRLKKRLASVLTRDASDMISLGA